MISNGRKNLLTRAVELFKQPLFANAGFLMGINLIGPAMGFVYWGLAARLYRPEDVGLASAIWSAVTLVAGIARLGTPNGIVRFLPESQSPRRMLNTVITFDAAMAVLVGGVFLAGLQIWSPSLTILRHSALLVAVFLTIAIVASLQAITNSAFIARRQAQYALFQAIVINGGRLLLIFPLIGLGALGLVGSMALAIVFAIIISLIGFLPRVEPGYRLRLTLHRPDLASIIPYSLGNYVAAMLAQISQTILPLITLELLGPAANGHAYITWQLAWLLFTPGNALSGSAFAEASNDPPKLTAILARASVIGLALTLLGSLILLVAAPWVLLIYGSTYSQNATELLRLLTVAAPLVIINQFYFTYLRVEKKIGSLTALSGIVAVVTIGTSWAFMPSLGIIAGGIGWLAGNGLVALFVLGQPATRAVISEAARLLGLKSETTKEL